MIDIIEPLKSYKEFPGPVLVLAGPGTGKTYQLGKRVKFLISEHKAEPDEIAVITFTNDAARNMREALTHKDIAIPRESQPEIISTMHSLGNSIIGTNPSRFGLKEDYDVLHEEDPRVVLLKDATTIVGLDTDRWKSAEICRRKGNCTVNVHDDKCKICKQYKKILRKCCLVDYDDQILLACEVLRKYEESIKYWQRKTRYLLIDEYQDINQAQCELIQLLTEGQLDGLFAVGDDDQSIYSFRGGSPEYIRDFETYFGKQAKIGRLSKSWRCPEHILKGARGMVSLFNKDSVNKPEPTFDEKITTNNKIQFYDVPTDKKEAQIIAAIAKDKIKTDKVIIIIPNRKYLPPIKAALSKASIDYKYKLTLPDTGLVRFSVLADWVDQPHNNAKLRYLVHLMIHNFDKLTMKVESTDNRITSKREMALKLIAGLWNDVNDDKSLYEVLCSRTPDSPQGQYLHELRKNLGEIIELFKEKGCSREALVPFLEKCGLYVAPCRNPDGLISELREWRNELVASSKASAYEPVYIYNMPSSKGLEGDVILVVGLSKDLFPHPDGDLEEQSRLFFVALTRAKKELHLFSARTRPASITFKEDSYQLKPSSFIDAITAEHIDNHYIRTIKQ